MIRCNHISRAVRVLSQKSGLDANDPQVILKLRELHPACNDPIPQLPTNAPRLIINVQDPTVQKSVRDIFRRQANGSTPGPLGITGEHLHAIAEDDDCLRGLALILQLIINGDLSPTIQEYILTSTLIALPKGADGVRPIAIGDQLLRAANAYVNKIVQPRARTLCEPHQFGLGTPGGVERVVLSVDAMLHDPTHRMTAFLTDIINAFNTKSRAKILHEVYANPELAPCWRLVHFIYGCETKLRLANGTILLSRNGVKQGETLVPSCSPCPCSIYKNQLRTR